MWFEYCVGFTVTNQRSSLYYYKGRDHNVILILFKGSEFGISIK